MAGLVGDIPLAPLAVSGGTVYQLWQGTAPTNQLIKVAGILVFQNYNTNGTPGQLTFLFAGTGGTGGTSVTPVSINQAISTTFRSTWLTNPTAPSSTTTIRNTYVNPQVNVPEYFPRDEEFVINAGGIFVVQYSPQVSGNVTGWLRIEE